MGISEGGVGGISEGGGWESVREVWVGISEGGVGGNQ